MRDTRVTHTVAIMQVSQGTYEEIRQKMLEAGYDHAIMFEDEKIYLDMNGIALEAAPQMKPVIDETEEEPTEIRVKPFPRPADDGSRIYDDSARSYRPHPLAVDEVAFLAGIVTKPAAKEPGETTYEAYVLYQTNLGHDLPVPWSHLSVDAKCHWEREHLRKVTGE